MVVRGMEYQPGIGPKQLAWIVHTGIMGAVIAPICFLGGPILTRAAWYVFIFKIIVYHRLVNNTAQVIFTNLTGECKYSIIYTIIYLDLLYKTKKYFYIDIF